MNNKLVLVLLAAGAYWYWKKNKSGTPVIITDPGTGTGTGTYSDNGTYSDVTSCGPDGCHVPGGSSGDGAVFNNTSPIGKIKLRY